MSSGSRIPISLRLDPATVKLIDAEQKRAGKKQTEVIEDSLTLVLSLSERALNMLAAASKKTGKREERLLEECILAELAPSRGGSK
jgi:hypothetical protein